MGPFGAAGTYKEVHRFHATKLGSINCLQYSHDGLFIAAGTSSGEVYVWSTSSNEVFTGINCNSAVTSLLWRGRKILSGSLNGTLSTVDFHPVSGFSKVAVKKLHTLDKDSEIRILALSNVEPVRLASAARSYVTVWKLATNGESQSWTHESHLTSDASSEMDVVSVDWSKRYSNYLIVGDASGEIVFFDTLAKTVLRKLVLDTRIGSLTILHNESLAVAHNLLDGFDMYKLEPYDTNNSRRPFHTLRHELGPNVPLPCLAVHGGFAVAGGSGVGRVRIWDIKTKQKFLSLRHEGNPIIQAISAHYDKHEDRFSIVTGTSEQGENNYITLWVADCCSPLSGNRRKLLYFLTTMCVVACLAPIIYLRLDKEVAILNIWPSLFSSLSPGYTRALKVIEHGLLIYTLLKKLLRAFSRAHLYAATRGFL